MNPNLLKKMELIKNINSDDSNFIIKVCEAYLSNQNKVEKQRKNTSIILKEKYEGTLKNVIDLDKIYSKPYFYTKMRCRLEKVIEQILISDERYILENPSEFCKKTIFQKVNKIMQKPEQETDIVEFIQTLDNKKKTEPIKDLDFIFIADKIDEETLFKEEQLKKAIEIINIDSVDERNEKIYEEVYNYLKSDFVSNHYCDFKNDKCVAQRKKSRLLYTFNSHDGCCFKIVRYCEHLNKGNCNVECLACRLFSCDYLTKRGIEYYGSEFVLLKAFLTKNQRKHLIFDFYKPKEKVLEKLK